MRQLRILFSGCLLSASALTATSAAAMQSQGATSEVTLLRTLAELAAPSRQPCPRPPARASAAGDTIRISTSVGYPCTIAAAPSGIELLPSADGSRPDAQWTSVVRDSRGRFFTAARRAPGNILVWNANGSFNSAIGRQGQGPGEISRTPTLYVGPGDTLYAFHGARISVFAPTLSFVRELRGSAATNQRETLHVADDGRFISGVAVSPGTRVHIAGVDGAVLLNMGRSPAAPGGRESRPEESSVAYAGGTTFWTALAAPARDGYLLEEWSFTGQLRRVVYRSATWARSDAGDAAVVPGGFPYVRGLSVDPDGIIWVMMLAKDPSAGPLAGARINDGNESQFFDVRYEAIDPNAGAVLVSGLLSEMPSEEGDPRSPPLPFFLPRSRTTYNAVTDSATGLQRIRFFEMRAVRK